MSKPLLVSLFFLFATLAGGYYFLKSLPDIISAADAKHMQKKFNEYTVSQGVELQELTCPPNGSRIGYCTFHLTTDQLAKMQTILHLKPFPKDNLDHDFYDLQNESWCTRAGWDKAALKDNDVAIYQVDASLYPTRPVYFPMGKSGYAFENLFYNAKTGKACADIFHSSAPEHIDLKKDHP